MSLLVLITAEFVIAPSLEASWMGDLPASRRAEIGTWTDERDRHRSLLGSRLLVAGLADLGFSPDALNSLAHPPQSRPTLDLPIAFSISHCDGRIVCALSTRGPVGIDVERLSGAVSKDFHVYLNEAERAWAGRSSRRFYCVWTRKEAVVKAAGSSGLREVSRVDSSGALDRCELNGHFWHTRPVPVGRSHVAHLAVSEGAGEVTVRRVSRQVLERGASTNLRAAAAVNSRAVL